jgi:hypothetical protein
MGDYKRVEWVREKLTNGLAIDVELFEALLESDANALAIQDYLDGGGWGAVGRGSERAHVFKTGD